MWGREKGYKEEVYYRGGVKGSTYKFLRDVDNEIILLALETLLEQSKDVGNDFTRTRILTQIKNIKENGNY